MRKKRTNNIGQKTKLPRLPDASSLGACGHESGMAAGLWVGLLLKLGARCLRKLGALTPSSHSDCGIGEHGFGIPLSKALPVSHVVGQAHWNLVAICAMYLEH